MNLWLRWANEWTARFLYPFNVSRREELEDALDHYRWATELVGDAALWRAYGMEEAVNWMRLMSESGSRPAPFTLPVLYAILYAQGMTRRGLQAPGLLSSALDAWLTGHRRLIEAMTSATSDTTSEIR